MMKNMASNNKKAFFLSFLLTMFFSSSYLHLGMCETSLDQLLPALGQGVFLQDAQCMQKLLPCQEYLKSPNSPSQACCGALTEMHDNNTQCLCNFINNDTSLFQSVSVSKDEILKLPQACGINVDLSKCNNTGGGAAQGGGAQGPSSPASEGEGAVPDEDTSESTSSTKMITPYGITYFGVSGFVALLTALVFSSY